MIDQKSKDSHDSNNHNLFSQSLAHNKMIKSNLNNSLHKNLQKRYKNIMNRKRSSSAEIINNSNNQIKDRSQSRKTNKKNEVKKKSNNNNLTKKSKNNVNVQLFLSGSGNNFKDFILSPKNFSQHVSPTKAMIKGSYVFSNNYCDKYSWLKSKK